MEINSFPVPNDKAPTGWKVLAFFAPYFFILISELLFVLVPTTEPYYPAVNTLVRLLILGMPVLALAGGLYRKLPAWSLPSLGFVLGVAGLLMVIFLTIPRDGRNSLIPGAWALLNANPAPDPSSAFYIYILRGLFFLWPLVLLAGLLALLSALLPGLRPFYLRLRSDWSLLSLVIYVSYLFTPAHFFDPPAGSLPFKLVNLALLAAGAWLYFGWEGAWRRLAVLLAAAFLAQSTVSAGVYFLYIEPSGSLLSMLRWFLAEGEALSVLGSLLPLLFPALLDALPMPSPGISASLRSTSS